MIFNIEGNIGAGKTTLMTELAKDPNIFVVYEPVEEWIAMKIGDKSLFELFYSDKKQYAFVFQMYILNTRIQAITKAMEQHPTKIIVSERSIETDLEVFAKSMHQTGFMSDLELIVYQNWHASAKKMAKIHACGTVYLKANVQTCMKRINKRSREGESVIIEEYIETIERFHENWFLNGSMKYVTVDVNDEFNHTYIDQVKTFIYNTASAQIDPYCTKY
jgi:deoxyadenosine/deoxycytidine kinase